MAPQSILPSLLLEATATHRGDALEIRYSVSNRGPLPVFVLHLDFQMGGSRALVKGLGEGAVAVFFGTERLPPQVQAAWMPRAAASHLGPAEVSHHTLSLPLPLAETGSLAIPVPESVPDPVAVERMLVVIEVMLDEGGEPPPASLAGDLDPQARTTPHEYLRGWIELPPEVRLQPVLGGTSLVAHGLPASLAGV